MIDMKLYQDIAADRDRIARERDQLVLAILAEEGTHQVFGTPVDIHVTWPQGLPDGFADAEAVRRWSRDQLAEMREQR